MNPFLKFFLIACISFAACKEKATTTETSTETTTSTAKPTKATPPDVKPELTQDKPLSAYAQQFYTNELWRYEAAVVMDDFEKSKAYNGKWIKFYPNNTLETGFYESEAHTGSWKIDEENNILTIVENTQMPTYSEWKVKTSSSSDNIMIWVGTPRFGTNNTQIKMLRYESKPSKGVGNK